MMKHSNVHCGPATNIKPVWGFASARQFRGALTPLTVVLAACTTAILVFAQSGPLPGEPENIVTIAGTGPYLGDGNSATLAGLNAPEAVALDPSGNIWITDAGNNVIRKVDAVTGIISTEVGTGKVGFGADNVPASQSHLSSPSDLAFDAAGNLYFTDAGNNRIRKVNAATGIITTIAGEDGIGGYSGDGGMAVTAHLFNPRGIALAVEASGLCIYTADLRNHRIRKIDGTGKITTVAGTGTQSNSDDGPLGTTGLNTPFGVALDANGNLYIGEGGIGPPFSHRIRKVDFGSGMVTTVAGLKMMPGNTGDGGLATLAKINSPRGISVDSQGNIYFVDNGNHKIRRIDAASGIITTVAGTGEAGYFGDGGLVLATEARFFGPFFLTLDNSGNIYIGDRGNSRVRRVDAATGKIDTVAGGFVPPVVSGSPALSSKIGNPAGLAIDTLGNIFFAENFGNRVLRLDSGNGKLTVVAGNGEPEFNGDNILATDAHLNSPQGVALDDDGNLYVADFGNKRVRKVSVTGIITTVAGDGETGDPGSPGDPFGDGGPATEAHLNTFRGVALDPDGNLWIADSGNNRVRFVNMSTEDVEKAGHVVAPGNIDTIVGKNPNNPGENVPAVSAIVTQPIGLAFDANKDLFLTDGNRVRAVNLSKVEVSKYGQKICSGCIQTIVGTGLNNPQGLAFDPAHNLYIADNNNHRIRRVNTEGVVTTVAGSGEPGFSGDGGLATTAAIQNARFLAFDDSYNLHFTEFIGSRLRRLNVAAKEVSVVRTAENFLASVEVPGGRAATDLYNVRLNAVDALGQPLLDTQGQPLSSAASNSDSDPTDPANPAKRVFTFGLETLDGNVFRLDGILSGSRRLSGDAPLEYLWNLSAPLRAWLGLKNSDDQGTRFDLGAEVYRNNDLVASGLTLCIAGITRNAARAVEALVPLAPLSPSGMTFRPGDVLSLRVMTRIGTQPDGTKCQGHNNAVGLRLYYDGAQRPSGFGAAPASEPPQQLYLHSGGSVNFLSATIPSAATPLFKDSPPVNFSGGNPWKEIAVWSMTLP